MKKVSNYIPYIIILIVVAVASIFIYDFYFDNKVYKDQIKALESEKDSISVLLSNNDKTIAELTKQLKTANYKYNFIKDKLNQQQNETDNVPDIVYGYDEKQLDSTIRTYKHIKRPKN